MWRCCTCDSVYGFTHHYHGEWLNSLKFHGNIKCITANGDDYSCWGCLFMLGLVYISWDDYSFSPKLFGKCWNILNIHLWLCAASHDWSNSMPVRLRNNYVIHSVHKVIKDLKYTAMFSLFFYILNTTRICNKANESLYSIPRGWLPQ